MPQFALPELAAMQQIANIVSDLTPAERKRVAAWLVELASQDELPQECAAEAAEDAEQAEDAQGDVPAEELESKEFETFAELYEAVAPRKGAQKAAVAGWWLETKQGQQSWKASEVNKLLKSIDVKISSMSIVLTNAVKAKDPLMVELERLGNSERSRKTFCLSDAGFAYVESALA